MKKCCLYVCVFLFSAFFLNGGLYLFYYILQGFSPDPGVTPEMKLGGHLAIVASLLQLIAGMFLIWLDAIVMLPAN